MQENYRHGNRVNISYYTTMVRLIFSRIMQGTIMREITQESNYFYRDYDFK